VLDNLEQYPADKHRNSQAVGPFHENDIPSGGSRKHRFLFGTDLRVRFHAHLTEQPHQVACLPYKYSIQFVSIQIENLIFGENNTGVAGMNPSGNTHYLTDFQSAGVETLGLDGLDVTRLDELAFVFLFVDDDF
jgi:hypothetical protein